MQTHFNCRHRYYFQVVAKDGSIFRVAGKLDMAVQTVCSQPRGLERSLDFALLQPAGHWLPPTRHSAFG